MKGYFDIQGQTIILLEPLPENLRESIALNPPKKYPFPTFQLGVKEEYLNRETIYEPRHYESNTKFKIQK